MLNERLLRKHADKVLFYVALRTYTSRHSHVARCFDTTSSHKAKLAASHCQTWID